jgi:hypothetical protein
MAGRTPFMPFDVDKIVAFEKVIWSYNDQLFVFRSLAELKMDLTRYFERF